jgi:myo-inositol 2-dehydrogenase/D-chiro-inositol 1-dehydrogenase
MSGLRVGVVGSGFIAKQHLRSWRANGVELAVFSQDGEEAARLGVKHGIGVADSLEELLTGCDIADVCTPTDQHLPVVAAAAAAGVHVVCEKPLARTSAEAAELVAICEAAGVRLFPAHVVRYIDAYVAAWRELDRGTLGTIAVAHLSRSGPRPTWSSWFGDRDRSGGLLMDLLIHDYDIAQWFAGPVRRVWARALGGDADAKEVGLVVLTHESGAISHVEGVWDLPGSALTSSFQLYGDAGYVTSTAMPGTDVRLRDGSGMLRRLPTPPPPGAPGPFELELADFSAAVRSGGAARVTPVDGLSAVRVAEAAVESARRGTAIELEGVGA